MISLSLAHHSITIVRHFTHAVFLVWVNVMIVFEVLSSEVRIFYNFDLLILVVTMSYVIIHTVIYSQHNSTAEFTVELTVLMKPIV